MNAQDDRLASRHNKPFVEHLEDLRGTLLRIGAYLLIGVLLAIPLAPTVVSLLKIPLSSAGYDPDQFLRVFTVSGGFSIAMRVVFWSGLMVSLPFAVFEIGRFIFPGLTGKERRTVMFAAAASALLFACGVALAYFFAVPVALKCLFQINEWLGIECAFVELGNYVVFVLQLLACFGLVFELPIVIVALGAIGIVSSAQLRDKRRHSTVVIFILAAILTPSTDAISMLIMAIPMIALYEICVWIVWLMEKKAAFRQTGPVAVDPAS